MQSPRLLLLGPHGQLGRALEARLATHFDLVAAGRQRADLAEAAALGAVVGDVRPAVIVNAAAYTAVDAAENDAATAWRINAVAPGVLAAEAARIGAAFVHFSTDYVFDGSGTVPWREHDPPAPLNEYGRGKLAGERAVQAVDVPQLIVRTSWLYAPGGQHFIAKLLRLAATRDEVAVVSDQVGAPTPAALVAEITAGLLTSAGGEIEGFLRRQGGVLHVAASGETSWAGLAAEVFSQAGLLDERYRQVRVRPIASDAFPSAAKRPYNSRLDLARLREEFGIVPPDWRAALRAELPAIVREHRPSAT